MKLPFAIHNLSTILLFVTSIFIVNIQAQSTRAERQVRQLLEQQARDWNAGDIEAFMQGYWKSDKLVFIGSRGLTFGWEETLNNYKKGFPDKKAMGHLRFELDNVRQQSRKVVSVVGKFILDREKETLDGHFLLLVKKIKGTWFIIADHTS